MTDRPMLFSGPMVRALLAGRKTQTRRIIKWQGPKGFPHSFAHARVDNPAGVPRLLVPYRHPDDAEMDWAECGAIRHYGPADPGDRIWVKETWRTDAGFDLLSPTRIAGLCLEEGFDAPWAPVKYEADGAFGDPAHWIGYGAAAPGRVRVSIHMPRWASRITLHVTDVRVERLQDISVADAVAEGALSDGRVDQFAGVHAIPMCRAIWTGINGADSWDSNPWVTALTFSVERQNIDRVSP